VEYGTSRAVFAAFGDPYAGLNFADVPTPSVIEVVFGLFGLPLGAGIVEELVYRGYPLPPMIALSEAAGWAADRGVGLRAPSTWVSRWRRTGVLLWNAVSR
jgi:hypothetical protein